MASTLISRSSAISIRNRQRADKPNEDCFRADDVHGLYLLADGVTCTPEVDKAYPDPSGGALAARTACGQAYEYLVAHRAELVMASSETMIRGLSVANDAIYDLNVAHRRYAEANFIDKDYFGAVIAMGAVVENRLYIVHVGDVMVLHCRAGQLALETEIQTEPIRRYQAEIRRRGLVDTRALTIAVRKDCRNHVDAKSLNGEGIGYGVLTGEPGVYDFVRRAQVSLQEGDRILLVSDGFQPLISAALAHSSETRRLCRLLEDDSDALGNMVLENERFDNILDDATAILVTITGPIEAE